jgi:hypothetical protein
MSKLYGWLDRGGKIVTRPGNCTPSRRMDVGMPQTDEPASPRLFADAAPIPETARQERGRLALPTVKQATLIVIALGLVWRTVRYLLAFPLWGDEAFVAVNFLARDLAGLSHGLEFGQVAPPGFLWAEWGIARVLGSSEWALRLIPFLASVGALLLFWRFCRKVATRRVTLVAVALLAASFYPVRHGNEVKPYAIDLFVSLLLTSLGWAIWRGERSLGRWLALIAAATIGVWCSYTAVFPVAGVGMFLSLLLLRPWSTRRFGLLSLFALLSAASWATMAVVFMGPQARETAWLAELTTWRDAFPPLSQPWRLPWWLLDVHTSSMLAYPHGGRNFASTATFLLVVAGVRAIWQRRVRRPLLLLLLGPLVPAFVAAALHRYPYGTSARVMLYMAPAFCLLAGEGVVRLGRLMRCASWEPIIVAGMLGVLPIAFTIHDVRFPYSRPDDVGHRQVARVLAERTAPGDQWIVFNGATPPPRAPDMNLSQWLQRVAEIRFYLLSLSPVPTRWEPDPRTVVAPREGRTWLIVQRHGCEKYYPYQHLADYQRALIARLGKPAHTEVFVLKDRESIEVWMFEPPHS